MNTSVVICSHNRSSFLLELLNSFKDQTVSPDEYELVVVDNASSDKTKDVILRASRDLKNLKYFYEPELGLSQARNVGIKKSEGEIIAFIDDDALPEPDWIEMLIDTFRNFYPMPVCVGGRILAKWEASKPAWLPADANNQSLSLLDLGEHPIWLFKPSLGAGNLAVRKFAFSRIGEFNKQLGRKGNMLFSMEEILFLFLVLQEFGKQSLLYQPNAVVYHRITEDRIVDQRYVIRRSYWDGASKAVMKSIISKMDLQGKLGSSWFQLAKYGKLGGLVESVFKLAQGSFLGFQAATGMDRKKLTECLMKMAFGMGEMTELVKSLLFIQAEKSSDA